MGPGVLRVAPTSGERVSLDEAAGRIDPGDKATANGMSLATTAVRVHLNSVGERIQHALGTFAVSRAQLRAELGYDIFLGRGSTILYIGEKI
jgi:hypothetical protein